ncbi:MAG: response regulator [Ignavibacteriae bacterium]|nr:response regulator [Ignavibacteriota bacterium]
MIKAVIIDDERSSRQVLMQMLNRFCSNVNVVASAGSADAGKLAINQCKPDVVFLDVEMPYETGFELLQSFHHVDFGVVFVSAHQRYIEEARQYAPLGFLLKPINAKELKVMMEEYESGNHRGKLE